MSSPFFPFGLMLLGIQLIACSGKTIHISAETQNMLAAQQEITAIHYAPSPFLAEPPEVRHTALGAEQFGIVGAVIAGRAQATEAKQVGSQLMKDYNLEDPILKTKRSFLDGVSRRLNLQNIHLVQDPLLDDDRASLIKQFEKGLVFDFKTTTWSLTPLLLNMHHYHVQFTGRARLLSFPEGKIEWQGTCEAEGKMEQGAPTLLQLVANSGTLLKEQLMSASESCSEQLERQFMESKP